VADSGGTVFNEVMAAYSGLVFSTALRKLPRDAESAREVTQNVFLMAFRKREVFATLAYPASLLALLHLIREGLHGNEYYGNLTGTVAALTASESGLLELLSTRIRQTPPR
jgi:hypothetical protein